MERADVVVVGGGVLGASTALHLKLTGVERVTLLERDGLAQGTTAAGGGLVGVAAPALGWGREEDALERYGLEFYGALAEDGYDFGWRPNGMLWAVTPEAPESALPEALLDAERAPENRRVSASDIEELTGVIPAERVAGGIFHPIGGRLSARDAALALAHRFQELGGIVDERRPVTGLMHDGGRVRGVETSRGPIHADAVVLAAGAWTNELLGQVGFRAPMVVLIATRIITNSIGVPPTFPALMMFEFEYFWAREEGGGLLYGANYEGVPRYSFVDRSAPERFAELPIDGALETRRVGQAAAQAIPALGRYTTSTVAHGGPCYTADTRGMVGPIPNVDGLFMVGGCNECGVTHGPGFGRLAAELVTGGEAFVDVAAFDPGRFDDRYPTGASIARARSVSGDHPVHGAATA